MRNSGSVQIRAAGKTDPGNRKGNNEDAMIVFPDRGLFLIADGMGGMNGGEVAARMTVEGIPPLLGGLSSGGDPQSLVRAVQRVSRQIYEQALGSRSLNGMGATVVLAWLDGTRMHLAYAGDSRAYLFRKGRLTQLTDDHSVTQELLRRGAITQEQAEVMPWRGQLTRHMGMKDLAPDTRSLDLEPGDRVLLCTDGLYKELSDEEIVQLLTLTESPGGASEHLVWLANDKGGRDNITAVVIDVN